MRRLLGITALLMGAGLFANGVHSERRVGPDAAVAEAAAVVQPTVAAAGPPAEAAVWREYTWTPYPRTYRWQPRTAPRDTQRYAYGNWSDDRYGYGARNGWRQGLRNPGTAYAPRGAQPRYGQNRYRTWRYPERYPDGRERYFGSTDRRWDQRWDRRWVGVPADDYGRR